MPLKRRLLEEESDVLASFWIPEDQSRTDGENHLLVIRYHGVYRIGCNGNSDATYMAAIGRAAIEVFQPAAIVIDLSDLSYQWGDMLDTVWNIGRDPVWNTQLPCAVVIGDKCRAAIGTLIFGEASTTDACEEEFVFDTLAAAVAYVSAKLVEDQ
jgi:hypothetical protein